MKSKNKFDCKHKRRKRIYTHGRKSPSIIKCKDCGKIISRNELAKEFQKRQREKNRRREW